MYILFTLATCKILKERKRERKKERKRKEKERMKEEREEEKKKKKERKKEDKERKKEKRKKLRRKRESRKRKKERKKERKKDRSIGNFCSASWPCKLHVDPASATGYMYSRVPQFFFFCRKLPFPHVAHMTMFYVKFLPQHYGIYSSGRISRYAGVTLRSRLNVKPSRKNHAMTPGNFRELKWDVKLW